MSLRFEKCFGSASLQLRIVRRFVDLAQAIRFDAGVLVVVRSCFEFRTRATGHFLGVDHFGGELEQSSLFIALYMIRSLKSSPFP